jgi:cytosine/adenosine deaminase-related metal-dependent hydrolase
MAGRLQHLSRCLSPGCSSSITSTTSTAGHPAAATAAAVCGQQQQQPQTCDIVVSHACVLTVNAERHIFSDGAVAIRGDSIAGVGRTSEILRDFAPTTVIDACGGLVHPGFVDCHVHVSQHLGRGMIPDDWPEEREHDQWKPYWLQMSREDARCSAMLACLEMLRNGTTTFCDSGGRYECELNAGVVEQVGLRGMLGEVCWDQPPYPEVGTGDTANCLRRLRRLCEKYPWRRGSRVWCETLPESD